MPKKPNRWQQPQNYVPKGNGDASGEYADGAGGNIHFAVFAKPLPKSFSTKKTTPVTPKNPTANATTNNNNNQQINANIQQQQPTKQTAAQKLQKKVDDVINNSTVKNGSDTKIADYKRDSKKYQFGIEQAMAEQGFDGLPQVVDAKTFDEIVKKSNFIAQRGVRAPDQQTLDDFTQQLYKGKWYVDCSNGGAQYGQGMYCAADYTGKLTQGIKNEAKSYAGVGWSNAYRIETLTLLPDSKVVKHLDLIDTLQDRMKQDKSVYEAVQDRIIDKMNLGTLTVDEEKYLKHQIEFSLTGDVKHNDKVDKSITKNISNLGGNYSAIKSNVDYATRKYRDALNVRGKNGKNYYDNVAVSSACESLGYNDGELATLLGYDAINAEDHGQSGSYTVILNRTKVVFKKQ